MPLPNFSLTKRVSFQKKLFFTKHLDTMIKAGIPLAEALETLRDQEKTGYFREVMDGLASQIKNGKSLTDSLRRYPNVFNDFYVNLIKIGEKSGTLEKNLDFLAKQLNKDYALSQKVRGAMMYPGLIFFATVVMGGFISLFVLPKLVDFFDAFDFPLPLTTRILLGLANLMKNYGVLIVGGLTLLGFGISMLIQTRAVKPIWHRLLLKLPLFGGFMTNYQTARFARNLGVLIKSGLPIDQGLEVTAETLTNVQFQTSVQVLAKSIAKGQNLSNVMNSADFSHFPVLVSKMIGVGEKTGKLDETLIYLADFYEEEIDNLSKNLATILEPALLLGIGLIVGFVAMAIISPIYELTGSIGR